MEKVKDIIISILAQTEQEIPGRLIYGYGQRSFLPAGHAP